MVIYLTLVNLMSIQSKLIDFLPWVVVSLIVMENLRFRTLCCF